MLKKKSMKTILLLRTYIKVNHLLKKKLSRNNNKLTKNKRRTRVPTNNRLFKKSPRSKVRRRSLLFSKKSRNPYLLTHLSSKLRNRILGMLYQTSLRKFDCFNLY